MDFEVATVGAGPYGLSCAAFLRDKGVSVGVFGDPMSFWRTRMPAGMFLRSNWKGSHIADPHKRLTLDDFVADSGSKFAYPIPLDRFIAYGEWFQQRAVPDLHRCQVSSVEKNGRGFKVTLDTGDVVRAQRVLVATGIEPFPWVPKEFEGLPKSHVTHSSEHSDLSQLQRQRVVVVGGGQSALDAARLLSGYGVDVEVIAKQPVIRWVGENRWLHELGPISKMLYSTYDVGPAGISRLVGFPNIFRRLPRTVQDLISTRAIAPAGTGWQRPYLAKVPMTLDCRVVQAEMAGEQVRLKLSDGSERVADHVIVATGYRADVQRYRFLDDGIKRGLRTAKGHPVLGRGLESSVEGLHFVGKPAAWSFGPLLNFVSGANFAGPELARALGK
jgi:FAD-dependent urate hydroxylase